jgi:anti-sigma factor RsiW
MRHGKTTHLNMSPTMSHDLFDERLSAYLDGQLAPAERAEIESLLRQRPELETALRQVRELGDGIRELPKHSLGPDFAERVLAAAQQAADRAAVPLAPPSRRRWLMVAVGAVAATAALVLAMIALSPRRDNNIVKREVPLTPAEQAVAAVLAQAEEGKAVIVRLRLTKDAIRSKALDQALAASGISSAAATAANPAAQETAQGYKTLAAENQGPAGAADVLFIEADRARLQQALAAVAQAADGSLAISSAGAVPSTRPGLDRITKAEGEGTSGSQKDVTDRQAYAQHLPPRGFPVLKTAGKTPQIKSPSVPPPAGKAARVLVVVEVIP